MRFIAFACLALVFAAAAHAQPTRPPVGQPTQPVPAPTPSPGDKKDATKATAEIIADPLKVGKVAANDTAQALTGSKGADAAPASSANINERYLVVAGRGEYTVWANLAQIFVSVQPRVFQAAPPAAANATVSEQQIFLPDDKAKDEIKKVYERVIGVLEKHKAVNISSPASFVASPMFEPNATAFRMLMEHQSQMMARRRKALAQRAGRNLLIRGRPLSMSESPSFGVRALHKADVGMRPRTIHTVNAMDDAAGQQPQQPAKPAEQKADEKKPEEKKVNETATPAKVDESAKKADIKADAKPTEAKEEALVPLPDPKSLINFRGFRFYRPLSAIVPIESVMEIAQSLRAVNASIDSVQLSMSPMAFDEARAVASRAAVDRALAVADAALGAANEKRTKLNTVVISSSPAPRLPRLPMFRAAFLRPQSVNVVSNVVLRVNF